jgi:hypothetical protein
MERRRSRVLQQISDARHPVGAACQPPTQRGGSSSQWKPTRSTISTLRAHLRVGSRVVPRCRSPIDWDAKRRLEPMVTKGDLAKICRLWVWERPIGVAMGSPSPTLRCKVPLNHGVLGGA